MLAIKRYNELSNGKPQNSIIRFHQRLVLTGGQKFLFQVFTQFLNTLIYMIVTAAGNV